MTSPPHSKPGNQHLFQDHVHICLNYLRSGLMTFDLLRTRDMAYVLRSDRLSSWVCSVLASGTTYTNVCIPTWRASPWARNLLNVVEPFPGVRRISLSAWHRLARRRPWLQNWKKRTSVTSLVTSRVHVMMTLRSLSFLVFLPWRELPHTAESTLKIKLKRRTH